MRQTLVFAFLVVSFTTQALAQCEIPKSSYEQAANIFTPEQEGYLGEVMALRMQHEYRFIDDEYLNGYINALAQKLAKTTPSGYEFRVQLVDEPYSNAWSTPGGRIYVTRKAALLALNEDELAGLLGHEMSHVYTRQIGADFTQIFHRVLGVDRVDDKADVFRRYNQFLDTWRKKPMKFDRSRSEQEQRQADLTALYMMARAGYRPAAFGEYFDRLAETQGKTGGFWSDLFGTTSWDSKRLRVLLDNLANLPANCIAPPAAHASDFTAWQKKLLGWSGNVAHDDVRDVLLRTKLYPPLLSDMNRLRFSPDGRYILAQDDSSVSVLTRQPFAFLFRVDLPKRPLPATFTPDSKLLVVGSANGRVEKWDLISMQRVSVYDLPLIRTCFNSQLSPDGDFMACYSLSGSLELYDLTNSKTVYEKKDFYLPTWLALWYATLRSEAGLHADLVNLGFSPDGQIFAAASMDRAVALNLRTKAAVALGGNLGSHMQGWFVFAGSDRIITHPAGSQKAYIQEFPFGKELKEFEVGAGVVTPATSGEMATVSPIQDFKTGILDLQTGRLVGALKTDGFDMFGSSYTKESRSGLLELGRYDGAWGNDIHVVALPAPQVGNVGVLSVSDDLHWIALSEATRGGLFSLTDGQRKLHVRSFLGAWIAPDDRVWFDFPKYEKAERSIVTFSPSDQSMSSPRKLDSEISGRQRGAYFVQVKSDKPGDWKKQTIEVREIQSDKLLWSKPIKENSKLQTDVVNGTAVVRWNASSSAAKEAAKNDEAIARKLKELKNPELSYFFEILDLKTGESLSRTIVDTGSYSFAIVDVQASHNYLVLSDTAERIHVIPLKSSNEPSVIFGDAFDLSSQGLLAVLADKHRVEIYDAGSMAKIDDYSLASPLAFFRFLPDGKRLLVLTRDQTVIVLRPQVHSMDTLTASGQ